MEFSRLERVMERGASAAKVERWTERLERYDRSGQTVAEFFQEEGVAVSSFYRWKNELACKLTGKFGYRLPIYRQQDYFADSGWALGRSTLLNILTVCYFIIEPLLNYFRRTIQNDSAIGCDDTGVTLLYPKTLPAFDLDDPKQRRIHEVFIKALEEGKTSINAKMWGSTSKTYSTSCLPARPTTSRCCRGIGPLLIQMRSASIGSTNEKSEPNASSSNAKTDSEATADCSIQQRTHSSTPTSKSKCSQAHPISRL